MPIFGRLGHYLSAVFVRYIYIQKIEVVESLFFRLKKTEMIFFTIFIKYLWGKLNKLNRTVIICCFGALFAFIYVLMLCWCYKL
jgi:hypothetical protein